jgi:hypothetical protein
LDRIPQNHWFRQKIMGVFHRKTFLSKFFFSNTPHREALPLLRFARFSPRPSE